MTVYTSHTGVDAGSSPCQTEALLQIGGPKMNVLEAGDGEAVLLGHGYL